MCRLIIAIDGPAGSGKSTIAKILSEKLGYTYIDTGAMYRACAWAAVQHKIPLSDERAIADLTSKLSMRFEKIDGKQHLFVDHTDVTDAIRTPEVTQLSSPVSAIWDVRKRMVQLQREMAEEGGVVMEGRDIGTVVFPNAEVKVFLTASPEERARRRYKEMLAKGLETDLLSVAKQMRERDERDSTRQHAPLTQAPDAVKIDTDCMTIEEVADAIMRLHNERAKGPACTG